MRPRIAAAISSRRDAAVLRPGREDRSASAPRAASSGSVAGLACAMCRLGRPAPPDRAAAAAPPASCAIVASDGEFLTECGVFLVGEAPDRDRARRACCRAGRAADRARRPVATVAAVGQPGLHDARIGAVCRSARPIDGWRGRARGCRRRCRGPASDRHVAPMRRSSLSAGTISDQSAPIASHSSASVLATLIEATRHRLIEILASSALS